MPHVQQEECFISNLFQIGNRFALTAAHCLFDEDFEEVMHSLIAKDCLLTLVKSRLALGSPGCLFVRLSPCRKWLNTQTNSC